METVLVSGMWIGWFIGLLLLPLLLFLFTRRNQAKRRRAIILSMILLMVELLYITLTTIHPPLINATGNRLSDESAETVRYVSNGRLNDRVPIFPIAIVVTENTPSLLRWRTYYSIRGSTEHIWDAAAQCYECTDQPG